VLPLFGGGAAGSALIPAILASNGCANRVLSRMMGLVDPHAIHALPFLSLNSVQLAQVHPTDAAIDPSMFIGTGGAAGKVWVIILLLSRVLTFLEDFCDVREVSDLSSSLWV